MFSKTTMKHWDTPPKTNMEPENEPLEMEIPIKNHHFQVPCLFSGVYCSYWVAVISSTVLGCASGDRAWGAGKRGTDTPGSRGFVAWSIQLNLFYQKHYYNPKNPEPLGFLVGLMCISKIHPFFFTQLVKQH